MNDHENQNENENNNENRNHSSNSPIRISERELDEGLTIRTIGLRISVDTTAVKHVHHILEPVLTCIFGPSVSVRVPVPVTVAVTVAVSVSENDNIYSQSQTLTKNIFTEEEIFVDQNARQVITQEISLFVSILTLYFHFLCSLCYHSLRLFLVSFLILSPATFSDFFIHFSGD